MLRMKGATILIALLSSLRFGRAAEEEVSTATSASSKPSSTPDVAVAQFAQVWYGPDGPWSAVEVEIGNPRQKVYLTVSTLLDSVLPITPGACGGLTECIEGRGYAYNQSASTTWEQLQDRDVELYADMTAGLILNGQAYGMEVRGWSGEDSIYIAGLSEINDVAIGAVKSTKINNGLLGLRNLTNQMYLQRKIPSPSWSYHPGAREDNWSAQLLFGGYDPTKYLLGTTQNHSMTILENGSPTMRMVLDYMFLNITGPENKRSFKSNSSLLETVPGGKMEVTVDSSTPFCWLPRGITDRIAQSVGAVWNSSVGSGFYVYNTSAPAYKNLDNATLAFHFNGTGDSWLFNSVSLSHWLTLDAPTDGVTAGSPLKYLPLKPVDDTNKYVLGRSFLQQIYMTANYHTKKFSLSQIDLGSQRTAKFIKIDAPPPPELPVEETPTEETPTAPSSKKKLSEGAIAGIVIGIVAAIAIALSIIIWRRRQKTIKSNEPMPVPPDPDKGIYGKGGVFYREMSADSVGFPGRMVPPREMYAPSLPQIFYPPAEMSSDNYSLRGREGLGKETSA